ncbi:MAG: DUF934 domain-containing protein [Usitatibacteraceae bacterium]
MSELPRIIRDRAIVADDWTLISAAHDPSAALPKGKLLVPAALWLAQRNSLKSRDRQSLGVWLESNEDPAQLADSVEQLALIAVNFPKFTDGRGYSIATLLRNRYGYKGELRAIGDVLRDQLFYMQRVGFNAFALRADKSLDDALTALSDFSETYQGATDQPAPLFRRRPATATSAS